MQKNICTDIIRVFEQNPDKVFLKNYTTNEQFTGKDSIKLLKQIAKTLIAENIAKGNSIAIYSQNCPEWTLIDLACLLSGIVSVPIFATNHADQTDYILNDAGVKLIFVGSTPQYSEIMNIQRKDDFRIIVLDPKVELKTSNSIYFTDWITSQSADKFDEELESRKNSITNQDLTTLIYTSGTTGKPKGVKLTHRQLNALLKNHNTDYKFKSSYTSLAFLPLSHVFERGWTYIVLANGMTNVYLEDPKLVSEAIAKVKPETLCSVPRLYEKIYAKILDEIKKQSIIKQKIFFWSVEQGKRKAKLLSNGKKISKSLSFKTNLADKLVFSKIRSKLGGNLVFCPCGGAYIPDELVLFFRAIGIPILVGYGLTESSATVTSFKEDDLKIGTVGKPIIGVEIKIGENNEILVKGETVTSGYYKLEEDTKALFTDDGWLKTGDAGRIDDEGYLYITDRIKELIKTANGKYIAPQLIEGKLIQSPFISQAMIVGEGKPYVSALFTLDREIVENWAKNKDIKYNSFEELAKNPVLMKSINKSIDKKQNGLSPYEKVKRFIVLPSEFTMANNELTPTLKLKRKVILDKYSDKIENMYNA